MVILTISYGGLTAGLKAGKIYNTFPMMGPYWLAPEIFSQTPFWLNFFEEPVTVQFIHRLLAICTFLLVMYTGSLGRSQTSDSENRFSFMWLQLAVTLQVLLGIGTLIWHVPLVLALIHQAWAVVVFASLWWIYLIHFGSKKHTGEMT